MSDNVINNLKRWETYFNLNHENFVSTNYFNYSMLDRMSADFEISHKSRPWHQVVCGSWSSDGSLLGCGKLRAGVETFKPFANFHVHTAPVARNCFLADFQFMLGSRNLVAASQSIVLNGLEMDHCVKVWDVVKNKASRTYCFRGLVKKLATFALPIIFGSTWMKRRSA